MNVDAVLEALNRHEIAYLLIGGIELRAPPRPDPDVRRRLLD